MARPKKYTEEEVENIRQGLKEYIEKTDIPILCEFAYQNDVPRQTLYDYEEFSTLRKKLIDKKEAQLEKLATLNVVNPTMAIFSLKQLGWKDKQQTELTGKDGGAIEIDSPRDKITSRIDSIASRQEEGRDS